MALIRCNDCGRDVSDTAQACPHCGWQIEVPAVPFRDPDNLYDQLSDGYQAAKDEYGDDVKAVFKFVMLLLLAITITAIIYWYL